MGKILIKSAGWVVTMDPERRILTDGAVAIEDDRIVEVGKTNEIVSKFKAEKVIDAQGKLVLPGLIDTHVHNTQQLGRGLADGCEINVHLLERLYGYETAMMQDDAYWAALCCQLELIRAGTTCFIDPGSYFPQETAKAVGDSGLRGVIARTAFDLHSTPIGELPKGRFRETTDEAVERAQQMVTELNGAVYAALSIGHVERRLDAALHILAEFLGGTSEWCRNSKANFTVGYPADDWGGLARPANSRDVGRPPVSGL